MEYVYFGDAVAAQLVQQQTIEAKETADAQAAAAQSTTTPESQIVTQIDTASPQSTGTTGQQIQVTQQVDKPLAIDDLNYLKPFLIDYVSAGVHAAANGGLSNAAKTVQIEQILSAHPEIAELYSIAELLEAGNMWTDDYLTGLVVEMEPLTGSIASQIEGQQQQIPASALIPQVPVAQAAPVVAGAQSSLPNAEAPLPGTTLPGQQDQGGLSIYSFFVFGIFGYALYMIAKRYFAQRSNENFNKNYMKRDFADGFI